MGNNGTLENTQKPSKELEEIFDNMPKMELAYNTNIKCRWCNHENKPLFFVLKEELICSSCNNRFSYYRQHQGAMAVYFTRKIKNDI